MTHEAQTIFDLVSLAQRAGCSKKTTAEIFTKLKTFLRIDADDVTQIKLRLGDVRHTALNKANSKHMEAVGHDPFGFAAKAAKERARKATAHDRRTKRLGSVFNPIDHTGSPKDIERLQRQLDAKEARGAR